MRALAAALLLLLTSPTRAQPTQPESTITGRITDPTGAPIPFAPVIAKRLGGLLPTSVGGTTTDAKGHFQLGLHQSGDYILRIRPRDVPSPADPDCSDCCAPHTELAPTDYPSGPALHIEPGQSQSNLAITLRRNPVYCVQGAVRTPTGAPRHQISIILETPDSATSVLHRNGRFLLTNLWTGTYALTIREPDPRGRVLARELIHVRSQNGRVVVRIP